MSDKSHKRLLQPIFKLVRAVQRRERLSDAAEGLARVALPAGLALAAVAVMLARTFCLPLGVAWVAALPVPAVLAWAYLRPRSVRATARRIDAHFGLFDRLGNALEFARPGTKTGSEDPFSRAIVDAFLADAARGVDRLEPAPVVPVRVPPLRRLDLLAALFLGSSFLVPQGTLCPDDPATMVTDGDDVPPDELEKNANVDLAPAEPLIEDLRDLKDGGDAPAKAAATILDVLDALEKGEIDRAEAFAMLEALDQDLLEAEDAFEEGLEEDPWLLGEAMRDLAEQFEQHEITEEVAEALEKGDSEAAEEALAEAMEKAERESGETQEALDAAMKDAEKSLGKNAGKNTDTASQLSEEERRLKRQQKRPNADPEEQERRLKRQQERVDQLRRQHEREKAAQRKLDQLRRNAQQSRQGQKGQQGQNQKNQQGKQGKQGGQKQFRKGMKNASQKSSAARRMSGARDALEEAKTFVRRSGQQGENEQRRRAQQKQFSKRAKGKGKQGKDGKDGKKGKSTLLVEGKVGQGEPDMFMESDKPGDAMMQGQGNQPGDASLPGGEQAGDGHVDPFGESSEMDARKKNVRVDADHGRGATRAEVISTASQDGFANESYKRVYKDYRAFAQSAMDSESMPAGKRRRVKRYFQMIQPRD